MIFEPDFYIMIILAFYIFLWFFNRVEIKKKYLKYSFAALKFTLLIPFWGIFILTVVLFTLPLDDEETGKYFVIKNDLEKDVEYSLAVSYDSREFYVMNKVFENKFTSIFNIVPGKAENFKLTDHGRYQLIRQASNGGTTNRLYNHKNGEVIMLSGGSPIEDSDYVINFSFEINNIIALFTAMIGIWCHLYYMKEDEVKTKFFLGGAAASIFNIFLIYRYVEIILYWKS